MTAARKTTAPSRNVEVSPAIVNKAPVWRRGFDRLARVDDHERVSCRAPYAPGPGIEATTPPSTSTSIPLSQLASSDKRNETTAATSSGRPPARAPATTLLLEQNVRRNGASEVLGHTDVGITLDLYSHVTPTMQSHTASAFDDLLGESGADLVAANVAVDPVAEHT